MKNHRLVVTAFVAIAIGACGHKDSSETAGPASATSSPAPSGAEAAKPTGKIVTVDLNSDATGNSFKPAELTVHRGDIIRFTLKSGVHNVHFLPDSNPGKTNLPAPSDMLQLPDQTFDLPVNLAAGKYYFQCDPHAPLGMKGHVEVED